MSRTLLCEPCGKHRPNGTRMIYDTGPLGEPPEYERVVWGTALAPQPEHRVMEINGERVALPADSYDCDHCGRAIPPGARACAVTITVGDRDIGAWETGFVLPT